MKLSTRTIVSLLAVFPIGLMTFSVFGQEENLVPNGSFENLEGKLKALGCIENATGWSSPTGVRADIFTPSKSIQINVPENTYGKEDAKDGTNYAGIVGYSFGDALPRSYVMAKLNTPLKKGMKYCVRFSLSLSEASKYASNQIGVSFSSKAFGTDSKTAIIEKTHILDFKNKIFSAMYNWEDVCGTFYAEGGEKYLTIGNFTSNENTKNEKNKKDPKNKTVQLNGAYYYIDNVSVIMLVEDAVCDCGGSGNEENMYSTAIFQKIINVNERMSSKDQIELQTVYFGFGKSKLLPSTLKSLDLVVSQLKANPKLSLDVIGHNDKMEDVVGADKATYADMAIKRSNEIIKYFTSKGIDSSRLTAISEGFSVQSPEVSEGDDDDLKMAKNRRVSFKVK